MISFVFDADILSTFAKIEKISLLEEIFGKNKLLMPSAVVDDLRSSRSKIVREAVNSRILKYISLNKEEKIICRKINDKNRLGKGETECIAACISRKAYFVSNDKKAIKVAEKSGVDIIDLETILFSLKKILRDTELKKIIDDIESKDKVVIVNKEKILG